MKGRGGLKVLGNSVLLQEPNSTGHGSVSSLQMQVGHAKAHTDAACLSICCISILKYMKLGPSLRGT